MSDRLVIQAICLPLAYRDNMFLWIYIPILIREVLMAVQASKFYSEGILVYPGKIAKIAVALVGLCGVAYCIAPFIVAMLTVILMLGASYFSFCENERKGQSITTINAHHLMEIQ